MLKPLGDRVVLQAEQEEEKTIGGIVLASNAQEKPTVGKVIAVGEGRVLENGEKLAPSVKENDRVLFDKYAGNEVKINGEEYIILRQSDILAVIE